MADTLNVSSILSKSHDPKTTDLKTLFAQGFNIETADHDLINKFVIHRFNQYAVLNAEDYRLWDCIQMDFEKFEAKHFDMFYGPTWKLMRDYCYPHGYWIDHKIGPGRTRTTLMLETIAVEWYNKWTLEQISWVEAHYGNFSRITCKRKQELTGISDVDSASNLEYYTEDSLGLWAELQTQPSQDIRFPPLAQEVLTQALPIQVPLVLAPLMQAPVTEAPPIQALPTPEPLIQLSSTSALLAPLAPVDCGREQPEKHLDQLTIASPSDICSVPSNTCSLVDKFVEFTNENADIQPPYKLVLLLGSSSVFIVKVIKPLHDVPETSVNCFAIYHPHYKKKREMIESAHKSFLLRPPPRLIESAHNYSLLRSPQKLLSLFGASPHCIIEVMNPLHDMLDTSKHWFTIYYPHYKDEQVSNLIRTLVCAADNFFFLSNFDNLISSIYTTDTWIERAGEAETPSLLLSSTLSKMRPARSKYAVMFEWQFVWDGGAYATEPGLVTKKGESPRTFIYHSHCFQPPASFFSLNFASFPLLADYSLVKLTSEKAIKAVEDRKYLTSTQNLPDASFDLSRTAQRVEYLPDDQVLLNRRLQWPITDKSRGLRYNQDTLRVLAAELYTMGHGFNIIEKRYWGRYQIILTKLYQHQYYGMGGTDKHEIGEYEMGMDGTSKYWHLATFRKSCQCCNVGSQLMLGM